MNYTRMIFEMEDAERSRYLGKGNEGFTYELTLPEPQSSREVSRYMLEDLNRYFELTATIEIRPTACWLLDRTEKHISAPVNFNGQSVPAISVNQLLKRLNDLYRFEPVVMEDGMDSTGSISIDLRAYLNKYPDTSLLIQQLEQQGFSLSKSLKPLSVLVIRKKERAMPEHSSSTP